ncbi:unnamed protein product [Toxocara canis]|nr:unnamed protein product [Toxocara canis]
MDSQRVFVVTGSQKGIGYGIVKTLATTLPNAIVYMTDTHECLLKQSLHKLKTESGKSIKAEVRTHQLDITMIGSVTKFADHLQAEHGGFDVLINNAGVRFNSSVSESLYEAKVTVATNYEGTKLVSQTLLPLMRNYGRVVNLASRSGAIHGYNPDMKAKLTDEALTVADVDAYVQDFLTAYEENNCSSKGYPRSSYAVTKTACILLARIWARELASRKIVVNACCPGYVETDMSRGMKSPLTIEQGADTPVYLATLEGDEPNGKFVYLRKVTPWY